MAQTDEEVVRSIPGTRHWNWRKNSTSIGIWRDEGALRLPTRSALLNARSKSGSRIAVWNGKKRATWPPPFRRVNPQLYLKKQAKRLLKRSQKRKRRIDPSPNSCILNIKQKSNITTYSWDFSHKCMINIVTHFLPHHLVYPLAGAQTCTLL